MSGDDFSLAELQHSLLAAITQVGESNGDDFERRLMESLLPSRQQPADERLAIYRHAYIARLLEVLGELFPAVRFAMGDEPFDALAIGYLAHHPPRSYTLARLADRFVGYLAATQPADLGPFLIELATLEEAIDRVFDGPGPERLPPFAMPAWADASLCLMLAPGIELHGFTHPVSRFYSDWKAGRSPAWPLPERQFVGLVRRDYIVRRYELSLQEHALLTALSRGEPLGRALAAAAEAQPALTADQLADEVHGWFTRWTAEGFFASTEPP
jgi:hypothetical protein